MSNGVVASGDPRLDYREIRERRRRAEQRQRERELSGETKTQCFDYMYKCLVHYKKKLWRDELGRSSSELTRDASIEIKRQAL